jgi:hypothetical protein
MSSAISLDRIQPSGTWLQAVPSAAVVSFTTTTIWSRTSGPTGAEPASG